MILDVSEFLKFLKVRRTIIQLCQDDNQRLNWYREALKMMEVHRIHLSEIPEKEKKWLVTSCWNQGMLIIGILSILSLLQDVTMQDLIGRRWLRSTCFWQDD